MRLVLAQIDTTVGDFAGNAAKIQESLRRGEKTGAHLVVVPEMALCGYPPRDLIERPAFQKEAAAPSPRWPVGPATPPSSWGHS